jgi:hypothetical protein
MYSTFSAIMRSEETGKTLGLSFQNPPVPGERSLEVCPKVRWRKVVIFRPSEDQSRTWTWSGMIT